MISKSMKLTGYVVAVLLLGTAFASSVTAEEGLTIRPFLIDETLEAREAVTHEISLENKTGRQLTLYATVNEITVDTEGVVKEFITPSMADRTTSVTSWIEITRGRITIPAGETATTSLTIHTNPYAKPGEYHAFIGFVNTNKRHIAEAQALAGEADGIPLKVTISEEVNLSLMMKKFSVPQFVFRRDHSVVEMVLENNGESELLPTGEIIFYDSSGEEVAATDINIEKKSVPPGETIALTAPIPFFGSLGRYKANATIYYGPKNQASIFDTAHFMMVPYYLLFVLLLAIIIFSIFITYLLKRAFDDERYIVDDEQDVPLRVGTGRDYEEKDHDITIVKK